jgi:hypothetical protein
MATRNQPASEDWSQLVPHLSPCCLQAKALFLTREGSVIHAQEEVLGLFLAPLTLKAV